MLRAATAPMSRLNMGASVAQPFGFATWPTMGLMFNTFEKLSHRLKDILRLSFLYGYQSPRCSEVVKW